MFRLFLIGTLALVVTSAMAQQATPSKRPVDQAKLAKCQQLAKERGFNSSMDNAKGANGPRAFVVACMQGKQN